MLATQSAGSDFCANRMHLARRHGGSIVRRVGAKNDAPYARVPVWGNEFTNGSADICPCKIAKANAETVLHYAIH